ncbi:MAG: glycerophosphodiester phosphodiesterase, partial [Verrucomicrobiales bacterium]
AAQQSFEGKSPGLVRSLGQVSRNLPALTRLGIRFLLRSALIALPFLAAIGGLAWSQLRANDINYYLAIRPPEFFVTAAGTALILALMAVFLIHHAISWLHALPLLLFDGASPNTARSKSLQSSVGQRKRIAIALALWTFGTPALIAISNLPWPALTTWAAQLLEHRLSLLALVLALILALSSGLSLLISYTTQSLLALYHLKLYRESGLASSSPSIEPTRDAFLIPWKIVIAAACIGLAITSFICHQRLNQLIAKDDALVIAHRGASANAPENTLAAIELAIKAGADWIEIDVQETQTGELLVFHDKDFMRTTGQPILLRTATAEELQQLDIGSWFDPRFAEERTPKLSEVLEHCRHQVGLIIELKYYGAEEALEERVIQAVEAAGMAKQVKLMSLKLKGIEKVRKLRPNWTVGLLSTVAVGDLTRLDIDFLGLNAGSLHDGLVHRAQQAGISIYAWTVNDPAQMSALLSRGIDGMITDRPSLCREIVDERNRLTPAERLLIDLTARLGRLPATSDP